MSHVVLHDGKKDSLGTGFPRRVAPLESDCTFHDDFHLSIPDSGNALVALL